MEINENVNIFSISVIFENSLKNDIGITLQNHGEWLWEIVARQKVASHHVLWAGDAETTIATRFSVGKTIWNFGIFQFSQNP